MANFTLVLKPDSEPLMMKYGVNLYRNETDDLENDYKMAAEVAVGSAVFVALAILLTLIWNSLKRNPAARARATGPSRSLSINSLERLVEHRLQDCPPPYSADGDKPPSYEDSFDDYTDATRSDESGGRFGQSSVQMQEGNALRNQMNVFIYDNEAFDGADAQLSGRPASSTQNICTISSELDDRQTTQCDQNDHPFSVHL